MLKQLLPAIRATLVLAVLTGLLFPLAITAVAQVVFPSQANGSLIRGVDGKVIGSRLIGQGFTRPEYFHPRPSAAGNGYDPTASGGTNLGSTSDKLINGIHKKLPDGKDDPGNFDGVKDLATAYRTENHLPADALVPVDAVTRSASGLDPHISQANALLQVPRVAAARKISADQVEAVVRNHIEGRDLGLLGEPRVNVLELNLDLDARARK
jgi:K+-transporting ATPase ATPase C chain